VAFDLQGLIDALEYTLTASPKLDGYTVDVAEPINMDPDRTPWIGIRLGRGSYTPLTIAMRNRPWEVEAAVTLTLQQASYDSGTEAQRKLIRAFRDVIEVLEDNPALTSEDGTQTIKLTSGIDWEPRFDEAGTEEDKHVYFAALDIELTVEARA